MLLMTSSGGRGCVYTISLHSGNKKKDEKFYWQRRRRRNFIALLFARRFNLRYFERMFGDTKKAMIFHPVEVVDRCIQSSNQEISEKFREITLWLKVFIRRKCSNWICIFPFLYFPPTRALFHVDTQTTGMKEDRKFWAQMKSREPVLGCI